MKANAGSIDRGLRVVAGISLIGLAVADVIGPIGYIGVVPLATGALAWCPLYTILGINTCSLGNKATPSNGEDT